MAYFMIFGSSEAPLVCERNLESSIIDTLNALLTGALIFIRNVLPKNEVTTCRCLHFELKLI